MIIRSDIPLSVSVLSTIFEVNARSLSQTMDLIGVVAMKALSLSLMTHSHLCYGFARVGPFEMRGDDRRIWGIGIVSDRVCSCL